jgi:hypothetical protein
MAEESHITQPIRSFGIRIQAVTCKCKIPFYSGTSHFFEPDTSTKQCGTESSLLLCSCGGMALNDKGVTPEAKSENDNNLPMAFMRAHRVKLFEVRQRNSNGFEGHQQSARNLIAVLIPPSILPQAKSEDPSFSFASGQVRGPTNKEEVEFEISSAGSISRIFQRAMRPQIEEQGCRRIGGETEATEEQLREKTMREISGKLVHPALADLRLCGVLDLEHNPISGLSVGSADVLLFEFPEPTLGSDDGRGANPGNLTVFEFAEKISGISIPGVSSALIKTLPISLVQLARSDVTALSLCQSKSPDFLAEIPSCPVCLHRMDSKFIGLLEQRPQNICCCSGCAPSAVAASSSRVASVSICRNKDFLTPWPPPSYCTACRVIDNYVRSAAHGANGLGNAARASDPMPLSLESTLLFSDAMDREAGQLLSESCDVIKCADCGMRQTLWVCLTCGLVACGRYSHAHAVKHHYATKHPYSLELATQRIWAYDQAHFVQRRDCSECPIVNLRPHGVTARDGQSQNSHLLLDFNSRGDYLPTQFTGSPLQSSESQDCATSRRPDQSASKKTLVVGKVYEARLQVALADQAEYYEGEMSHLGAKLSEKNVRGRKVSSIEKEEIDSLQLDILQLENDIARLTIEHLKLQTEEADYRTCCERLLRQQREQNQVVGNIQGRMQGDRKTSELYIEELQQQIWDLDAFLNIQHQASQCSEIKNAKIVMTSSRSSSSTRKKGRRRT